MNDVEPSRSGLASGVVNTAFMMGGALGLAIVASGAAGYTADRLAAGSPALVALNSGYHVAFGVGATCAAIGAVLSLALLRRQQPASGAAPAPAHGAPGF